MAENSVPERRRGLGRPFRKGKSGNPGGRPKAVRELLERARCAVPTALDFAESLLLDEEQDARVRLDAAKFLTAYGLGAPPRELPLVDDYSTMTDEELNRRLEQLREPAGCSSSVPQRPSPDCRGMFPLVDA